MIQRCTIAKLWSSSYSLVSLINRCQTAAVTVTINVLHAILISMMNIKIV